MTSDLTTSMASDADEFESLAEVWRDLLPTAGSEDTIYLTHEWVSIWWRHFGAGKELRVLLFERQGRVVGIVPLMRTEYRVGMARIRLLESVGALNCNYVWIVSPEDREEVASGLLAYLGEALRGDARALRLSFVPDDSTLLSLIGGDVPRAAKLVEDDRTMTRAPYLELPSSWEELFSTLSRKRRWVLRHALRKMEAAHQIEFRKCASDSLAETLTEFFDLHQRRWRSVNTKGFFRDPRTKAFYADIAERFQDRGWLYLSRLDVDGDMASAQFGFVYNGKLYSGTTARDVVYSRYSVGHVHYMFLLQDAIRQGLRELDLLQGDEPYKFHWTKSARKYQQVTLMQRGRCPSLRFSLLRAFFRAHEMRRFGLRESYHLRRLRKREEKEHRRMNVSSRG